MKYKLLFLFILIQVNVYGVSIDFGTTPDREIICENKTDINVSLQLNSSESLNTFIFNWNNTNYTFYDDSLVLGMSFENNSLLGENSTHAYDFSIYENNGTIYGATYVDSGTVYGKGLDFDGIDDYVLINNFVLNSTDTQTRCAIVSVEDSDATQSIVTV